MFSEYGIVKSYEFLVLNGRINGILNGKYSFISWSEKSTVDLAWGWFNCVENITKFENFHNTDKSKHGSCTFEFGKHDHNSTVAKNCTKNSLPFNYNRNFKLNIYIWKILMSIN